MTEEVDNGTWVYDVETISNFFSYVAINKNTKEIFRAIIWNNINHLPELYAHLSKVNGLIGYNNLKFDYPILHHILNREVFYIDKSADEISKDIYKKAQETIQEEYSEIRETEVKIPQLDLFRIWHFDNKAKITSLKKLEINMEFENVQDMPIHHSETITSMEQVKEILIYNKNDVEATLNFYEKTKDKIELRNSLSELYGINCLNYSDSKIGEQLMLNLYCQATGKSISAVRKQRTKRKNFKFSECIPQYINFNTPEFNNLLEYLKGIEVETLKESFAYTFEYNDFEFDLGTGGIHGCIKAGVYEEEDDYVQVDADIASMYPNLAITLGLYPEHLGKEFLDVYENNIVKKRIEAKRNGNKVMADGFKLSANSVYGKSNSEYSFLCDPLYTIKTTLGGQLAICMLCEMLMTRVDDLTMIQVNTDGLTVRIPKHERQNYWNICKEWEAVTKLELEYVPYKKMIIRDVNNYMAVSREGKIKYKGAFKTNQEMRKDGEWHKSFSHGIVAIALSKFYTENIPVEETIVECKNIYEFCKTGNTTGNWKAETFDATGNTFPQQKNNRYYLSTDGLGFRKFTYKPDKKTGEDTYTCTEYEAGKKVTMFNVYINKPFEEYNIDYNYYIDECYKIIHKLDGTEEKLENERKEKILQVKKEREESNFLKFCVNKIPTVKQYETYKKDWLIKKYGEIQTK